MSISLQSHKSLTDGSQLSLKTNFVEYITYGLHNQHIVDIKEFGERVLQFGAKREQPIVLYHQRQDQYIRVPESDKRREHSSSRSPLHKRHRSDTRGKQRHSPPSRRDTSAPDGSADTRLSTSTARPQNVLCYRCGKKHGPGCKLSIHPDANTNSGNSLRF